MSPTSIKKKQKNALNGFLGKNRICTFAVCSARYKTRPGLVYHYGHSHSTSSGDPAKELSPSPADVESRSVADTAASDQPGWSPLSAQFSQISFIFFLFDLSLHLFLSLCLCWPLIPSLPTVHVFFIVHPGIECTLFFLLNLIIDHASNLYR